MENKNFIMEYSIRYINGDMIRYPHLLYKYRDWSKDFHKNVLINNTLYFASPKDFEDIYDCNIPEQFPSKTELYQYFIDKAKNKFPNMTRIERREFAREWSNKSPLANPKRLSKLITRFNKKFNDTFGVLSMTSNPDNNEMWEKYGNEHKGFCVGFDSKLLFDCFGGGGGDVQYVDELPVINFAEDGFEEKHIKNTFFKEKKWAFEEEYRLHKMWEKNASNDDRNIPFLSECVKEIHLGKSMEQNDKEEIKSIVKKKYSNAKIIEQH